MTGLPERLIEKQQAGYQLRKLTFLIEAQGRRTDIWNQGRYLQQVWLTQLTQLNPGAYGYVGAGQGVGTVLKLTGILTSLSAPVCTRAVLLQCLRQNRERLKTMGLTGLEIDNPVDLRDSTYRDWCRGPYIYRYTEVRNPDKHTLDWHHPQRFGERVVIHEPTGRFVLKRKNGEPYELLDRGVCVYQSLFIKSCQNRALDILAAE